MLAGRLRHPVLVQTPTQTTDSSGGFTETWTTLDGGDTFASIEPVGGSFAERLVGARVAELTTHLVRLRYLANVTTRCRIVFGTRVFNIRGVVNEGERNRSLLLACDEATS